MNQVVVDKMKREIMVIRNSILFLGTERKTAFYTSFECDFEEKILKNFEYMQRGIAETHFDYKQPISYGVVINEENKIFVYYRGGTGSNAGDSRLHNKIAIGVGGHIEKDEEKSKNPISATLVREIEEEIDLKKENIKEIKAFGFINDDSNEVGKVHIGACYLIYVENFSHDLKDGEIANGEFISLEEYEKMCKSSDYDVENWSKILLEPLKNILKVLG